MDKKCNKNNEQKNNHSDKEQLNNKNEQIDNKDNNQQNELETKITDLQNQISELEKINQNINNENSTLKIEIKKLQDDFKNKLELKQKEAIEIINSKKEELTKLNEQKLLEFKTKLFSKDIVDLLNTIDQFEKIINTPSTNEIINNYINGFKMFLNMFENSISNMGIQKHTINIGDNFNEQYMEVIETIHNSSVENNCVVDVVSNCYLYNNNVIKFAKVKISKK